jgi:hypothetical protein
MCHNPTTHNAHDYTERTGGLQVHHHCTGNSQHHDDLDLVERTPHAFRGLAWLAAAKRLDAAGISYSPGARYNS